MLQLLEIAYLDINTHTDTYIYVLQTHFKSIKIFVSMSPVFSCRFLLRVVVIVIVAVVLCP